MSIMDDHTVNVLRSRRQRDAREYRWVFWIAYPFFLIAAIVARLIPGSRPAAEGKRRQSVFKEAWIAANSSIPFAFMN